MATATAVSTATPGPNSIRRIGAVATELVRRLPATSGRIIQKSMYLAEVYSIEERLVRLTDAEFRVWDFGPYSRDLEVTLAFLCSAGVLRQADVLTRRGPATVYEAAGARVSRVLDEKALEFIADFVDYFRGIGPRRLGDELTALAKSTGPYKRAKPRQVIDLDRYLREMRAKYDALERSKKVGRQLREALASP